VPRIGPQDNPFAELSVDLSAYASTAALSAKADAASMYTKAQVDAAIATKQDTLTAGSSLVFQEKLLQSGKVKSLAPGEGVGLTSTGDLVTISASGVNSAVSSALAGKQGVLTQPGLFGTELLYDSSKLKRIAFGQGLTGGTDLQPDGSQTLSMSVKSNLPVSTLTPPASTPLAVAGALQVSGLTQLAGLEASGVVAQQTVWVTGAAGAPAQSIMFPGSLQLGKWRIRGDELGAFILERFDDDGAIQTDGWQTIASFGHNVDTNVDRLTVDNLTVGGSDLGAALAAMEPAFVVEAPLEKI
jgi:hypothetical protein